MGLLDTLVRAASDAAQGYQQFNLGIRPALEEQAQVATDRKQRRAQTRLDFLHALTGGPQQAFQSFGDDYLRAVKDAQGLDLPVAEEDELAPTQIERQVGTRQVPLRGPFGTSTDVSPLVIPRETQPVGHGAGSRYGFAEMLRGRRVETRPEEVIPGPEPGPTQYREEPIMETGTELRPTGRKQRRLAIPSGPRELTVKLASGETVPASALKGLPADLVMHLVRGEQKGPVVTYGDVFGESLTPEFQKVRVQYDANGVLRFPPDRAFVAPQAPKEPTLPVVVDGRTLNLTHAQIASLAAQRERQGERPQMVTFIDPVSKKEVTIQAKDLPDFFPRKSAGEGGVESRAIAREARASEAEVKSLQARTNAAYQRWRSLQSAADKIAAQATKLTERIDAQTAIRAAQAKADQAEADWRGVAGELATKEATLPSRTPQPRTDEQRPAGGFDQLPSPKQYTGQIIKDTKTGKRYRSNGTRWVPVP